jgi:hypothetical protein
MTDARAASLKAAARLPALPEWRALLSDGPAVVMMAKADALALLDEIARLRAELAECRSEMAELDGLAERGG